MLVQFKSNKSFKNKLGLGRLRLLTIFSMVIASGVERVQF